MRLYSIVMPSQLAMDMQVCEWWGCSSVSFACTGARGVHVQCARVPILGWVWGLHNKVSLVWPGSLRRDG
jgi:hypothetical protein